VTPRVTLPTGERLTPLPGLDGEPGWDELMSLYAQAIPACINLRWNREIARSIAGASQRLPQLQAEIANLLPLLHIGPEIAFTADILRLALSAGAILQRRMDAELDDLDAFNISLAASKAIGQLLAAAEPIMKAAGVTLSISFGDAPASNEAEAQEKLRTFTTALGGLRDVLETFP